MLSLLALPSLSFLTLKQPLVLTSSAWRIEINPETLEVRGIPAHQKSVFLLSKAVTTPQPISHVEVSKQQVQWEFLQQQMKVRFCLHNETLLVNFTAQKIGEFSFPQIPAQQGTEGYLLPHGEGYYAPAKDAFWKNYLSKQDGWSTIESFSFPAWGVRWKHHVISYLLTNPFNNEVKFTSAQEGIGLELSHRNTRLWKVKEYGLRISLGTDNPIEPSLRYRRWLQQTGAFVKMAEKIGRVPEAKKLLGAAHVYLWGDGASVEMIRALKSAGLSRLWLGISSWNQLEGHSEVVGAAKHAGYLLGLYDSYHSIHDPKSNPEDTWETAQFDTPLYQTGGILSYNGKPKRGFQKKGYLLSPLVAQPYVEKRVSGLMQKYPCNSWFMDCDATGEVFDDFSPLHPATQAEDVAARLKRMMWIQNTYKVVMGSEGGNSYASGGIHFAQGMMTSPLEYEEPEMRDPKSPYFVGRYYPPEAPDCFFKQVPLKATVIPLASDATYRVPLYQAVFHDSVVTTHHWSAPSMKFSNAPDRTLLELLYNIPPLYHLDRKTFAQKQAILQKHAQFFTPLHRKTGLLPLTKFEWLTSERDVQKTVFGKRFECVANFSPRKFSYQGQFLTPKTLLVWDLQSGKKQFYRVDARE